MRDIKQFDELYARLDDMKKRAVRGEIGISAFFSPRDVRSAERYLESCGVLFFAYGGYADAERKRIYVLPNYMENVESPLALEQYGEQSGICAIRARGSGFCELSHRDFMGSLLALGIERDVIGDIVMLGESEALVICEARISEFLINEWREVGHDRIKCSQIELDRDFVPERKFASINDTVASARLDCVVAALCDLARERARECVISELCEIDYERESRPDREVVAPCLISIRGYGRFRVISIGGRTKKGRLRLSAQKFL